jgi:hypothetical protein
LARDALRFEIALEGVKFILSLEYAPRDAALTHASVPTPIAAATLPAVTAIPTPTQDLEEQNQQHQHKRALGCQQRRLLYCFGWCC